MKQLFILFLCFVALETTRCQSKFSWIDVNDIYSLKGDAVTFHHPVKIGSYYFNAGKDSMWIEKPLGTFLTRIDTLKTGPKIDTSLLVTVWAAKTSGKASVHYNNITNIPSFIKTSDIDTSDIAHKSKAETFSGKKTFSSPIFPMSIKKWTAIDDTFGSIPIIGINKFGFYTKSNSGYFNYIYTNTNNGGVQNYIYTNAGNQNYIYTNSGTQNYIYFNTGSQNVMLTNAYYQNYIFSNNSIQNYCATNSGAQCMIATNSGYQNKINTNNYIQNYIITNPNGKTQNYILSNSGYQNYLSGNYSNAYQTYIDTNDGTVVKVASGSGKFLNYTTSGGDTTEIINQTSTGLNQAFKKKGVLVYTNDASGNINTTGIVAATGSITSGTLVKAPSFYVSSIQTAPESATSSGSAGEIRFCSDGIYLCVTTNTWLKCAASSF
jgi:hypothetical protein